MRSLVKLGSVGLGGAALALAGCADRVPTAPASPAAAAAALLPVDGQPGKRYIVRTAGAQARARAQEVAMQGGGRVIGRVAALNALVVTDVDDVAALARTPGVVSVFEDRELSLDPVMEVAPEQVAPLGTDQSSAVFYQAGWQGNLVRTGVVRSWPLTRAGLGARVCIIDSGADGTHQDLAPRLVGTGPTAVTSFIPNTDVGNVEPPQTYAENPDLYSAPLADSSGHGSHVAGTAVSAGVGIAGVASDARLMIAKVFNGAGGGARTSRVVNAIAWCTDNGADVINMSLGFTGGVPRTAGNQPLIDFYQAGVNYATSRGVVVVASAGNDGRPLGPTFNMSVPGELNGVITTGATLRNTDNWAAFSNHGAPIRMWAPGSQIFAPCSRFSTRSHFNTAGSNQGSCRNVANTYAVLSGTSMAAPHVAGFAAVIRSRFATAPRSAALRTRIEGCMMRTRDIISTGVTLAPSGIPMPRMNVWRASTSPC